MARLFEFGHFGQIIDFTNSQVDFDAQYLCHNHIINKHCSTCKVKRNGLLERS